MVKEAQDAILQDQSALLDGFMDVSWNFYWFEAANQVITFSCACFLQEMLGLLNDNVAAVRLVTVQFLEDACNADRLVIPKVAEAFAALFSEETEQIVLTQISQSASGLFEYAVISLAKKLGGEESNLHSETWANVIALRDRLSESLTRPDCKSK